MNEQRFAECLARGQEGEAFLDEFFGQWNTIEPASRAEERQGIDRWFTCRRSGRRYSVEYKTDTTAARTGNAFIETVSVDTAGKQGWAFTTRAAFVLYYVPPDDLIYVLRPRRLRAELADWQSRYPTKSTPNEGYRTHGICVPLHELEQHADTVINLADFLPAADGQMPLPVA